MYAKIIKIDDKNFLGAVEHFCTYSTTVAGKITALKIGQL